MTHPRIGYDKYDAREAPVVRLEGDEYDEHDEHERIEFSDPLPGFPPIIVHILATLDDPEASRELLVDYLKRHPRMAARVILLAKVLAVRNRSRRAVSNLSFATTLIGINRTREITILSSIAGFVGDVAPASIAATFWQHSVAVGVCSEQLALATAPPASASAALIAGLLHDIGQLWLYRFKAEPLCTAWRLDLKHSAGIEQAEREHFGVDHSTIGAWLAEFWSLPTSIGTAIRHHHTPDKALTEPLVPLVHVAEVLSNALGLSSDKVGRVTSLSSPACRALGLTWGEPSRALFMRIEARFRHAIRFLPELAHPQQNAVASESATAARSTL
jgi:putative nucleotidyltransferase with HDIG domain